MRGKLQESPTRLIISAPLDKEDWSRNLKLLDRRRNSTLFVIGDLINYGLDNYGDGETPEAKRKDAARWCYNVAAEVCGLEVKTLWNYASVCRKVPSPRRREGLTFSHHEAVAHLSSKKQSAFLAAAETRAMAVADLREAIQQSERGLDVPAEAAESSTFLAWLAAGFRLITAEDLASMDVDRKDALRAEWRRLSMAMECALTHGDAP